MKEPLFESGFYFEFNEKNSCLKIFIFRGRCLATSFEIYLSNFSKNPYHPKCKKYVSSSFLFLNNFSKFFENFDFSDFLITKSEISQWTDRLFKLESFFNRSLIFRERLAALENSLRLEFRKRKYDLVGLKASSIFRTQTFLEFHFSQPLLPILIKLMISWILILNFKIKY